MGWGRCNLDIMVERRKPRGYVPRAGQVSQRRQCDEFYWNIASAISKTACLSAFFVVEAPRRVLAFVRREPEPFPIFSCARAGGFRMCACGHHFYEHGGLMDGVQPPSVDDPVELMRGGTGGTGGDGASGGADAGGGAADVSGSVRVSGKDLVIGPPRGAKDTLEGTLPPLRIVNGTLQGPAAVEGTPAVLGAPRARRRRWYWPFTKV